MSYKTLKSIIAATAISSVTPSFGWIVFDPSNFGQTAVSAANSITLVNEAFTSNLHLLNQYNEIKRLGQSASPSLLQSAEQLLGGKSISEAISTLRNGQMLLSNLKNSVNSAQGRMAYTQSVAQKYGITSQQYIDSMMKGREAGDATATEVLTANEQALRSVESSNNALQAWESANQGQTSQLAAIQMLNQQMSALVKQTNEMLTYQARQSTTETKATADREMDEEARKAAIRQEADARRARELEYRNALKAGMSSKQR